MPSSQSSRRIPPIKRGEIRYAHLNPAGGTEPGKVRPVLIFQSQALIDAGHPSTIIIPLTTNIIEDAEPLRIRVRKQGKLPKDSDLLIDQLRAIDNRRLKSRVLAKITPRLMEKVETAVRDILGYSA